MGLRDWLGAEATEEEQEKARNFWNMTKTQWNLLTKEEKKEYIGGYKRRDRLDKERARVAAVRERRTQAMLKEAEEARLSKKPAAKRPPAPEEPAGPKVRMNFLSKGRPVWSPGQAGAASGLGPQPQADIGAKNLAEPEEEKAPSAPGKTKKALGWIWHKVLWKDVHPVEGDVRMQNMIALGWRSLILGLAFWGLNQIKQFFAGTFAERIFIWILALVFLAFIFCIIRIIGLTGEKGMKFANGIMGAALLIAGVPILIFALKIIKDIAGIVIPETGPAGGIVMFIFLIILGVYVFASPQFALARFLLILGYVAMILLLIFWPGIYGPDQAAGDMMKEIGDGFKYVWEVINDSIGLSGTYERAIALASGDWYTGQVDENALRNLGVEIDRVKAVGDIFYTDENIQAYAVITAEALEDKAVTIALTCYANDKDVYGLVNNKPAYTLSVQRLEKAEADCTIPAEDLELGENKIYFEADFNFTTQSYFKTWYMRRDIRREYDRQNIDPFEEAKIEDREPVSKYTQGPISIGIGTQMTPPISLDAGVGSGPTFGVNFENKWDGELGAMKEIVLVVPRGMTITSINSEEIRTAKQKKVAIPELEMPDELRDRARSEGVQCVPSTTDTYCLLEGDLLEDILGTEDQIRTMRISTEVDTSEFLAQNGGEALMKSGRIGITARYNYVLKKGTEVRVEKLED
ncbi:DMT family transporter [Candidatus Woesearchaeota archaeon]|nr:DMT family transporter [Candidatus Woesearchaeota archaeon]